MKLHTSLANNLLPGLLTASWVLKKALSTEIAGWPVTQRVNNSQALIETKKRQIL